MGNNFTIVGEICETSRNYQAVDFEWRIRDKAFPLPEVAFCFTSPTIKFLDTSWHMSISPIGKDDDLECIGIFLWRNNEYDATPISFSSFIRRARETDEVLATSQTYPGVGTRCALIKCLSRSDLLKGQSYLSVQLTFIFSMSIDYPIFEIEKKFVSQQIQTECADSEVKVVSPVEKIKDKNQGIEGVAILQKHLKDLYLHSENHDVTLKVKGKIFRAHKNILGARSPVFATMLMHKEEKTKCDNLRIENCDPDAFDEFLQYIYTGELNSLTPTKAMGLYQAGVNYEIMELKDLCIEYLRNSMTSSGISDIIKFATEKGEDDLLKLAVAFFTDNMEEVLVTKEWQNFSKLSPLQVNELYLKALKTNYKRIK